MTISNEDQLNPGNSDLFDRSALVVAHPDDEILWFSSIFERVNAIIFCYSEVPSNPTWSEGRRKSLEEFPGDNIISLGISESEAINHAAWPCPASNDRGLAIENPGSRARYDSNYSELEEKLSRLLPAYRTVFTHNPWGEYGHEEHVQVYRAVERLQVKNSFDIRVSNYASNKSMVLMQQQLDKIAGDYLQLPTRIDSATRIMKIYQRNQCWTWYNDYEWFSQEAMLPIAGEQMDAAPQFGHYFPVNLLQVRIPPQILNRKHRLANSLSRLLGRP